MVDVLREKGCKVEVIEERSDIKEEVIPTTKEVIPVTRTPPAEEIYEMMRKIFATGVRPSDKKKWLKKLSEPENIGELKKIFIER